MQDLSPSEIEAIMKSIGKTNGPSSHTGEIQTGASENISLLQLGQLQEGLPSHTSAYQQEGLKEVNLKIDVVLGSVKLSLKQLLDLKEGELISLDKMAGEPVQLEINGRLIGYGEIVTVDDHYGIQLTHIMQ